MPEDLTNRYITKISRVAQIYTNLALRGEQLNASEYECLRRVRKWPGTTPARLAEELGVDRAAVTRLVAALEKKGFITRQRDEGDRRSYHLYADERSVEAKEIVTDSETFFYRWLLEEVDPGEREVFLRVLEQLYHKSKDERRAGFQNICRRREEEDV